MSHIIDRRLNPKDKNLGNRQRFLRRVKDIIKRNIKENILDKNIKDIGNNEKINVPVKDIDEPRFRSGSKGDKDFVLPGNEDFVEGDTIEKPEKSGSGSRGREGSEDGEGEDSFQFTLSREEFLEFFFEDLELPDLVKKQLSETKLIKHEFSGYTTSGSPSNLDIGRSFKSSLSRRIALGRPSKEAISELELKIIECDEPQEKSKLIEELEILKRKRKRIPFFDEMDMRYRLYLPKPQPATKAVMFCLMDVSASMGMHEKEIAKCFFMLLHLFLQTKYELVDIVFIRHHSIADEVDEKTFFYDKVTGGTVVSTALEKTLDIIKERYPISEWNIYVSQASDGDNAYSDNDKCVALIEELLNLVQYFAFIQVGYQSDYGYIFSSSDLWKNFSSLAQEKPNFKCKQAKEISEIYTVFRELFERNTNA